MATGSSEATSPDTEFGIKDISALHEALCPVSAKYKFFGLQIGVDINEMKKIEANYKDSSDCLLEILCSCLNQEPALTCADLCRALRSEVVNMRQLANSFPSRFQCQSIGDQNKETERESGKKRKAERVSESAIPLRMSEKESEDESESENIQFEEVERQVFEKDEPKSKRAQKRARKKERSVKSQCTSEQRVSENPIQLRLSKKESERSKRIERVESKESKSDESENIQKAEKSAELERQVHERNQPKSKRAKKRARKREKNQCASEQPEPDEYKEDERKQMKGKQKQKMQFSEMAASPQSCAESDQKRKKSVKESEKNAPEIISTGSENESSYACKHKDILLPKSEKKRECDAYSEVKHQPQSAKIREVKNEARKKGKIPEKEGSTKKQHSVLHRKTAVTVESDEDTSEQPSHKSKKKLEAEETESEESFSESTSDESESESPKHKEKVKPKSPTDTEEMYHDSDEEIEKVRVKDKNKMSQKSKVATAKSSPHSERLVEEEQCKQKKGKRSVDIKEQERESELRAKVSRGKIHKPHSQVKERERVKESDSGMKAKRLVAHSSEQASNESETDCENEESDSGNDSSEDGEDSEGKSSDEEEKRETDEESSTAPSEEEVKTKKKKETSDSNENEKAKKEGFEEERKLMEKRVSKTTVEQSKYDSPQGGRWFDETHTRKVKGKRESETASLKYDSPGDDEQSDPGHGSRDQEEHDIQQKRRKKKKQRRESSMSPTAIGKSSPSTSQEEKKKQPVSKKQGHRKKHVRKMKEKRERMKRGKEKAAHSSGTDDSSPECDMTKYPYKGELVNIFERFFGKLCCAVFNTKDVAAELQSVGLISKPVMKDMMLSPESQQAKIIALVDELDKILKSCPDRLFIIIEVMLENEALQETARKMLRQACMSCFLCPTTLF